MTSAADVSGTVLHVCNSIYNYQNSFVNSDQDFLVHEMASISSQTEWYKGTNLTPLSSSTCSCFVQGYIDEQWWKGTSSWSCPLPHQGIATGKYHAAVLTNNEEWEKACVKAGRNCGDLVHPLVYCPELHFSEFTSAVADMKNSVAVRFIFSFICLSYIKLCVF